MKELPVKISIIFPSYNGEDVISENLKSIQNLNNIREIETIIVDNNSTDSTKDIIKTFKQIKPNIIELNTNLGFGTACNIGVKKSRGEFIFITNQDVTFPKDFFEIILNLYYKTKKENEIILCPAIVFPGNHINYFGAKIHFLGFSYTKEMYRGIPKEKKVIKTLKASGCSMFLKKKLYLKLNGFDKIFFMYHEDTDFSLKAFRCGIPIYTTNKTILYHRKMQMAINSFTYYHIEHNRYIVLYKNIDSVKSLIPYLFVSEIMLLFQAVLTRKIKLRLKIYKNLIHNYTNIKQLRFSKFNSNFPPIKKKFLDRNLDPIILGRILSKVRIFRYFLKIINLFL